MLRTQKLGEADRIITALTRAHGQRRIVARGVRKINSKIGARLEPFNIVDLLAFEGRSGLDSLNQVDSLALFGAEISLDFDRYRAASIMAETAIQLTEMDASVHQFNLLSAALKALAGREQAPELLRDSYLLRSLALAGWTVELRSCVVCGSRDNLTHFSVQHGGVVCDNCATPAMSRISFAEYELLAALLIGAWVRVNNSDASSRQHVSDLIAAFVRWQLERGLKSLTIDEIARRAEQQRGNRGERV